MSQMVLLLLLGYYRGESLGRVWGIFLGLLGSDSIGKHAEYLGTQLCKHYHLGTWVAHPCCPFRLCYVRAIFCYYGLVL